MGICIGGRAFRPGVAPGIAAAGFIALAISLGNWQTRRAQEKLELGRRLDEGAKGPALSVPSLRLDASALERRRFVELAPEAASGSLRQNLVPEREEKRLGLGLQPFVIEQTSDAQDGLVRDWERPDA